MTLLKEQEKSISYPTLMIFLGILGIIISFKDCNNSVDEGRLTSIQITVKDNPKLIPGSKRTKARIRFNTNEYLSQFWISGTALSIVNDNDSLQRTILQIQPNDTLIVIFQISRQNRLDNPLDPVEIYGLASLKREYFSPGILASYDRKKSKIFFFCSSALLITGAILKWKKFKSKFNEPVGETT